MVVSERLLGFGTAEECVQLDEEFDVFVHYLSGLYPGPQLGAVVRWCIGEQTDEVSYSIEPALTCFDRDFWLVAVALAQPLNVLVPADLDVCTDSRWSQILGCGGASGLTSQWLGVRFGLGMGSVRGTSPKIEGRRDGDARELRPNFARRTCSPFAWFMRASFMPARNYLLNPASSFD